MIKIEISGNSWMEIQKSIQDCATFGAAPMPIVDPNDVTVTVEQVENDGPDDNTDFEPVKKKAAPKRKRRTKAEIEADEAGDGDDPREACRSLLKNIEAKQKAAGLVKASNAIKEILDDQGGEYDKPNMSNVEDASLPALVTKLEAILEGGA